MTTLKLMPGTELAATTIDRAAARAAALHTRTGHRPCLATVLVGDDPASATYVGMKQRRCRAAGIDSRSVRLPADVGQQELVDTVAALSAEDDVDGILVQHPVPRPLDERAAFEAIDPRKDVDGVTARSFAAMGLGLPAGAAVGAGTGFVSCTPAAILRLLDAHGVRLAGRHAVVIGRSPILGRPAGLLLLARDATVTWCHSKTVDLAGIVRTAEVVIAACGVPELVRGDWLRPGAAVVDAGYHAGGVGDVAFAEAAERAGYLTPVPGGVGPMTIAVLLEQTVTAAEQRRS
jgi:methylenetetrahydrofolate dehydrogenase (NADP+)/methenyltetrahydrofolate cyclohydrolase